MLEGVVMPRPRITVTIRGGNVVDVASDIGVEVFVLDYDNHATSDHMNQQHSPYVGEEHVRHALAEWDETAEENRKFEEELES
jgi:hypothetical protein